MPENLFRNPSFELGWRDEGDHNQRQVPSHWRVWFAPPSTPNNFPEGHPWSEIEMRVLTKNLLPPEEHALFFWGGEQTVKIFSPGSWFGYFYQRVILERGTYRLAINLFPDAVDHKEGSIKVPAPDPDSALLQFHCRNLSVSDDDYYGGWEQLTPFLERQTRSCTFSTKGGWCYVGAQFKFPWAIKSTAIFTDAWSLEKIGELEHECRGHPREQYKRVFVLLPPGTTVEERLAVSEAVHNAGKGWTVGNSADDAGIGDLDSRSVIALNDKRWSDDLKAFFQKYYPGVGYMAAPFDIPEIGYEAPAALNTRQVEGAMLASDLLSSGVRFVNPSTHHPSKITSEFGNVRPTFVHEGLDLRASFRGNGDMVVAAFRGEVIRAGYYNDEPWYGWQVRTRTSLPDGRVMYLRYAHMIENSLEVQVADHIDAGKVLGRPDNTGNSSGDHLHFDVKVGDKYADPAMLIDWKVQEIPPPPDAEGLYPKGAVGHWGTQLLGAPGQAAEFTLSLPAPTLKTVLVMGELQYAKPPTIPIYRHWVRDQDQYKWLNGFNSYDDAAKAWCDLFWEGLVITCQQHGIKEVWVESLNETYDPDYHSSQKAAAFDSAFIKEIARRDALNREIKFRAIFLTAGVGNPLLPNEPGGKAQWDDFLEPLFALAMEHGAIAGYHNYWIAHKDHPEWFDQLGPWLQYRFEFIDDYLRAKKIYVNWFFSESGPIGGNWDGVNPPGLNAAAGWKAVYGDSDSAWARVVSECLKVERYLADLNKQWGRRILGCSWFQVGSTDQAWKPFDPGDRLLSLRDAIRNEYA